MTAVVLVFFAVDTLRNAPQTFLAIIAIGVVAVVLDTIWSRMRPALPRRDAAALGVDVRVARRTFPGSG